MLGSMRITIAQSDHRQDQWIRGLYTDGRGPDPMHFSGSSDLVRYLTLIRTQDWAKTSVFFDDDICPMILASEVSLLIIMLVPSRAEFF